MDSVKQEEMSEFLMTTESPSCGLDWPGKEGLMTAKEELKEYIMKLSSEQIVNALPRLISELEAQGLPVHRLSNLQNELTLV